MPVAQDRVAAWGAAHAALEEAGVDQSRRVNVYDAIDRFDLFLTFAPLATLLGVALPDKHGVMVTNRRQAPVQRYTAAHELGHCVMHHGLLLDGEEEIHGHSLLERERQAQMFAAYFLMPPDLAHETAARHGITPESATPGKAYLAARDMGVSYEATVRHLTILNLIDHHRAEALLKSRSHAKRDAAFGLQPRLARADVWPIIATSEPADVEVTVHDEIVVSLPENRTTGYRWLTEEEDQARIAGTGPRPAPPQLASPGHGALPRPRPRRAKPGVAAREVIELATAPAQAAPPRNDRHPLLLAKDHYRSARDDIGTTAAAGRRALVAGGTGLDTEATVLVGGTGRRLLSLTATEEGAQTRTFVLAPLHDPDAAPAATWTIRARVDPTPERARVAQLLATNLDREVAGDPDKDAIFAVESTE